MSKLLAAITLFLCVGVQSVLAQCAPGIPCAGNPAGIPPDRQNSPYYNGGYDNGGGYGQQQDAGPPALWASFATDDQGRLSWTFDSASDTAASRGAMKSCRDGGGINCQIIDTFSEACGVPVFDMQHRFYMGYAASPRDAERYGVEKCDAANPTGHCALMGLPLCTGQHWSNNNYSKQLSDEAARVTWDQLQALTAGFRENRKFWGAIAVGPQDNTVRIATDELTKEKAQASSLSRCQGAGCRILVTFENTCAAIGYPTDPAKNDEYIAAEINKDPNVLAKSLRAKCDAKYGQACAVMVRCTGAHYPKNAPFVKDPPAAAN